MFCGVFTNTIMFGVFLTHFTNPSNRSASVMISDHAVIRQVKGELYFMREART
jgi:hypothetical protein